MMQLRRSRYAFTLVELLVVIAIIGLLSSVAVVSMTSARSKARDAKRLADMKQIKIALELYYDANGIYPPCNPCSTTGFGSDFTAIGIKPTYMSTIPSDPLNISTSYGYYYASQYKMTGNCSYASTSTNADFIMATRLENPVGVSGACSGVFAGWNNTSLNYMVGN